MHNRGAEPQHPQEHQTWAGRFRSASNSHSRKDQCHQSGYNVLSDHRGCGPIVRQSQSSTDLQQNRSPLQKSYLHQFLRRKAQRTLHQHRPHSHCLKQIQQSQNQPHCRMSIPFLYFRIHREHSVREAVPESATWISFEYVFDCAC